MKPQPPLSAINGMESTKPLSFLKSPHLKHLMQNEELGHIYGETLVHSLAQE